MTANVGRMQFGPREKGKSIRSTAPGRICRNAGCTTVLSIYNQLEDCSVHARGKMSVIRDRSWTRD